MRQTQILILINGMPGSGKTAIGQALCQRLENSACTEFDSLVVTNPWEFNKELIELGLRSAAAIINNHLRSNIRYSILSGGSLNNASTRFILEKCPPNIKVFWFWLSVSTECRRVRKTARGRDAADKSSDFNHVDQRYQEMIETVQDSRILVEEIECGTQSIDEVVSLLLQRISAEEKKEKDSSAAFLIEQLEKRHIDMIVSSFSQMGWNKPHSQYERYLDEQTAGTRRVLIATISGNFAGYATIVWESKYPNFREGKIPEIQDLNVLPTYRGRGIATALLGEAEQIIAARSAIVGMGVGLHPGYNAAQRLYVKLGYIPDGRGVTYMDQCVQEGQSIPFDDELVLWMTKNLN